MKRKKPRKKMGRKKFNAGKLSNAPHFSNIPIINHNGDGKSLEAEEVNDSIHFRQVARNK